MINDLEASNEQMRESIRVFDENLTLKMNKGAFQMYKIEALENFMHNDSMVIINGRINHVQD
jgi:hypothetical protein